MYYIYGESGPSLLIESTDYIIRKYNSFTYSSLCRRQNTRNIAQKDATVSFFIFERCKLYIKLTIIRITQTVTQLP